MGRRTDTPVLVRGRFDVGPAWGVFFFAAVLLAMGVHAHLRHPYDLVSRTYFYSFGGAILMIVVAVVCGNLLRRRWVMATPTGFVLIEGGHAVTYFDDDVIGLTRAFRTASSGGVRHKVTIELQGQRLRCIYDLPLDAADPLARLWERLVSAVARRAAESGLSGAHWRLDRDALHHKGGSVPMGRVTKLCYVGDRLLVWKDDDERAFLSLKASQRNVLPLAAALWNHPDVRRNEPLTDNPLGRVLHVQRSLAWILGGIPLAIMLYLAYAFFCDFHPDQMAHPKFWFVGVPYVGFFAFLVAIFHHGLTARLVFHENGASQPSRGGRISLLFDEMDSVVWFAGSQITLKPRPGIDKPPIAFAGGLLYEGEALHQMRTRMCLPLARRWLLDVPTRPVTWTKRLRFLPGGLEYTTGGLLSPAAAVTVPYHLTSYRIENHIFKLFVVGEAGPVFKEGTFAPNFFIGLAALKLLYDAGGNAP